MGAKKAPPKTPKLALSLEEFVEVATAAAIRASAAAAKKDPRYGKWPIWIGIVIRPPDNIQTPSEG